MLYKESEAAVAGCSEKTEYTDRESFIVILLVRVAAVQLIRLTDLKFATRSEGYKL